jgi:hypothetical protein
VVRSSPPLPRRQHSRGQTTAGNDDYPQCMVGATSCPSRVRPSISDSALDLLSEHSIDRTERPIQQNVRGRSNTHRSAPEVWRGCGVLINGSPSPRPCRVGHVLPVVPWLPLGVPRCPENPAVNWPKRSTPRVCWAPCGWSRGFKSPLGHSTGPVLRALCAPRAGKARTCHPGVDRGYGARKSFDSR